MVIRGLCSRLVRILRQDSEKGQTSVSNGSTRILNAPVHLGAMVANAETAEGSSIWIQKVEDNLVRIILCFSLALLSTNDVKFEHCVCPHY